MSPAASVTLEVRMIRKWDAKDTAPLLACGWKARFMPILLSAKATGATASRWYGMSIFPPPAPGSGSGWRAKGFVSVLESRFVGALFVAPDAIRQGIGRALLDEVKQHYAWLSLEVYQKNESAVSFYHAQGFRIEDCAWQDDTQHPTWIMRWPADQMP
jgi:putative acetyltransferase